jgi:membrane associated rhomboid family serine protease
MDITVVINDYQTPVSIVAVCIMVGSLVFAYYRKWMMTYAIIVANIIVFVLSVIYQDDILGATYANVQQNQILIETAGLGFRPIYISSEYYHQSYTLFTSMFVHSGFAHIFGNMLVFFFMGMAFEQRIGWKKFLIIYLLTGVCGALTQSVVHLNYSTNIAGASAGYQLLSDANAIPMVGASGAIFGILGAFAFSYPRDEVVMPIPLGIMIITRVKVIYAAIIFAAMETIIVWLDVQDTTAHFAHLGGLVSGFILAAILIRRNTHTKEGKTIYYDSFTPQKLKKIDINELRKLATTPELMEMVDKIEKESVPQVREIWLEHFLEKTVCPKCKNHLSHFDGKIWCERCDFKTTY